MLDEKRGERNEMPFVELCPVCNTAITPIHILIRVAVKVDGVFKHTNEFHHLMLREMRKRKGESK